MATSIEQRAAQLADKLGPELGPPEQLTPTIRLQPFYNGILFEINGECWSLAEATVAASFDPPRP